MPLSGTIEEGEWSVTAATSQTDAGGYSCTIRVSQVGPAGKFEHEFVASRSAASEHEAMLEGLREGLIWVELKRTRTIRV